LKRGFLHVFQKYSKKFISSFMYKKTIKECPVPLDISIKSNRKHHKTVLYSKSNKNMVGRLFGQFFIVFGQFLTETSGHPAPDLILHITLCSKCLPDKHSSLFGPFISC
jgi:hypothetical protein